MTIAADAGSDSKRARLLTALPMSLKVSLYFGVPLLLGIGLLAFLMLQAQREFQQQQLDNFAHVVSGQLAASAAEPLFADATMELSILAQQVPLDQTLIGVAIFNHEGEPLAANGQIPQTGKIQLDNRKMFLSAVDFYPDGGKRQANIDRAGLDNTVAFNTPITFRGITGGYALFVFNQEAMNRSFDQIAMTLLTTAAIIFFFLCAALVYCSYRITSPVRSIVNAANRMQTDGFPLRLERRSDELGQLIDALNSMNEGLAHKSQIEDILEKFLAPDVSAKIINELDPVSLSGENVNATVLFADIVGFTSMSERMDPSDVSEMLNEYFGYYSACAKLYFGTVDKFLGDCIMLVFGAAKSDPQHQYHAAACAVLMQELTGTINKLRVQAGKDPIYLRIGLNSGPMLAGLLGSADRMEYTVIGDSVNLASRLCNEAKQSEIIIQQSLFDSLSEASHVKVENAKTIRIRGKTDPVPIYNLLEASQARSNGNRALMDDIMLGVEARLSGADSGSMRINDVITPDFAQEADFDITDTSGNEKRCA